MNSARGWEEQLAKEDEEGMYLAKGVEIDAVQYPAVNRCTINDGSYEFHFLSVF